MQENENSSYNKIPSNIWRKIMNFFPIQTLYKLKLVDKNLNTISNEFIINNLIKKIEEERDAEDKFISKRINDHCEQKQGSTLNEKVFDQLFSLSEKCKEIEKELETVKNKINGQHEMRLTILNNDQLDKQTKLKMLTLCNPHSEFMNLNAIRKDVGVLSNKVVEILNGNNPSRRKDYGGDEDPLRVHDPLRVQRPRPNNPFQPFHPDPFDPFHPGNDPFSYGPTPDHERPPGFNDDFDRDLNPFFPQPPQRGRGQNFPNPFNPNPKGWGPRFL